jgi:hypothetical protein
MDAASKKAAKKHCLHEKRAAANTITTADMLDSPTEPPPIMAIETNDLAYPTEAIKDLWSLVAQRAARKAWQCNYIEEQM